METTWIRSSHNIIQPIIDRAWLQLSFDILNSEDKTSKYKYINVIRQISQNVVSHPVVSLNPTIKLRS